MLFVDGSVNPQSSIGYGAYLQLDFELVKVQGHQASNQKDDMDRLFTLVDRASRKALRAEGEQSGH